MSGELRTYPTIEQGTPEWHQLRCGTLTASVMKTLITAKTLKAANNEGSRNLTARIAAERITGIVEDTYQSYDMMIGSLEEPRARETYAQHLGVEVHEVGFMVREWDRGRLGYSPDGLVGDDGLIEIKCPKATTHMRTIDAGKVPDEHMAQIQAGLWVTGRHWLDFVSFHGGLPVFIRRVAPDVSWQLAIQDAAEDFEENVTLMLDSYRAATEGMPVPEWIDYGNYNSEIQVN